jgi:hypothetical protein
MSLFVNIKPVPFRLLDDLLAQMEANNDRLIARQGDKGGPTRPRPQRTVFNADASTYRRPEPAASPRSKVTASYGFLRSVLIAPEFEAAGMSDVWTLYSGDGLQSLVVEDPVVDPPRWDREPNSFAAQIRLREGRQRYWHYVPTGGEGMMAISVMFRSPTGYRGIPNFAGQWFYHSPTGEGTPNNFTPGLSYEVEDVRSFFVGPRSVREVNTPARVTELMEAAFPVVPYFYKRDYWVFPFVDAEITVLQDTRTMSVNMPVEPNLGFWAGFGGFRANGPFVPGTSVLHLNATHWAFNTLEALSSGSNVTYLSYEVGDTGRGGLTTNDGTVPYISDPVSATDRRDQGLDAVISNEVGASLAAAKITPSYYRAKVENTEAGRVVDWDASRSFRSFVAFAGGYISPTPGTDANVGRGEVWNAITVHLIRDSTEGAAEDEEGGIQWRNEPGMKAEWAAGVEPLDNGAQMIIALDGGVPNYCRAKLRSWGYTAEDIRP